MRRGAARAVLVTGEADWAWNVQVEPQILQQMGRCEGGPGATQTTPGASAERTHDELRRSEYGGRRRTF